MRRLLCAMATLASLAFLAPAHAEPQDFQIYKLGAPDSGGNEAFRIFANQLGVAVSSFNLAPPETLGHSAFSFGFGYGAAKVDTAEAVWPTAGKPPSDMLLMPMLHVRKGLPFSFELGGKFAYLQSSRMSAATVEVKWALNEGFFYFPDLGVRGYGTRMLGTRDFGLTTAGFDVGLGKQFPIGGMVTLTPYAGWNMVLVNATSSMVDFNPGRELEEAQTQPTTGLNVFEDVSLLDNRSNRFYCGMRLISYVVELSGEFSYTQLKLDGVAEQREVTAFAAKLGLDF